MYDIANMPSTIDIGFTGEKDFRKIEINMAKWMTDMPDGVPSIVHIRPGETKADAYIAATTFENNILTWTVATADLGTKEGSGIAQVWLEAEENDSVVKRGKSILFATQIHDSISDASEEIPAAQTGWLEQMTALKTATVSAAEDAEDAKTAAETAQGLAEDAQEGAEEAQAAAEAARDAIGDLVVESETLTPGSSATVTKTVDPETGDITLAFGIPKGDKGDKGDTGQTGETGQTGPAGQDGVDGVSPTVSVETISGGHEVTITDADGDHTFDVMDGESGDVIDDTAGAGDTDVTWSADKMVSELADKADISDIPDITGKADKVSSATNNNFAALDSNGNLKDSGYSSSSFASSNYVNNQINSNLKSKFVSEFAQIAPTYDGTNVYLEGDLCTYYDVSQVYPSTSFIPTYVYKHKSWGAVTPVAEADFNSSSWEVVSIDELLSDLDSAKVNEPSSEGTSGQVLTTDGNGGRTWTTVQGGGGGTSDYTDLTNKPQIEGVTLSGNKSLSDLGAAPVDSPVFTNSISLGRPDDVPVGYGSVALGDAVRATADGSVAMGSVNTAGGYSAVSLGALNASMGDYSTTIGLGNWATGEYSTAIGHGLTAKGKDSYVLGKYNIPDGFESWTAWAANTAYAVGDRVKVEVTEDGETVVNGYECYQAHTSGSAFDMEDGWSYVPEMNYLEIVGNGGSDADTSNARTLDWQGNQELAGDLTVFAGTQNETSVSELKSAIQAKYTKPSGGIPASDIASGVIPVVSGFYTKPSGGIPSTDLASGVTTSLGKADTAYQKPSGGIPSTDMASAVTTSLGKADTAYQKPSGGIPSTDMASAVQTSLGKADSAYQKPSGGIPSTDLASGVIPSVPTAYASNPAGLGTASPGSSTSWARGDHVHAMPTAANVGAIAAPSSPATGAFLVYNGSAWVAQTLSTWQGGSY